jgi:hypothetical protein
LGQASRRRWSQRLSTYNITLLIPHAVPTLATTNIETEVKLGGDGKPLVKMSVNREVIRMCRTRTSPMAILSWTKWR